MSEAKEKIETERLVQIEDLCLTALELETTKRAAFLDQACGHNAELRREVEALLVSFDDAEGFLEAPAFAFADGLLDEFRSEREERGRRIGPYEIIQEIDRGGMGAVYLATRADQQYEKQVAVKLVKHGLDTEDIRRRFRHERQILASLDHPNIGRLIDGGTTDDGLPYFVMDYVEGLPINQYCDQKRLTTEERLRLFQTICSAVNYAHQNLVIHRDLKPGNILATEGGMPKLLDFGIAKLLDPARSESDPHTVTQLGVMTPEYASPEQIKGENVTTASDVYSLGVLLYELLTGRRPYRIKSRRPDQIARVICEQEPEKPSTAVTRAEELPSSNGQPPRTITPQSISEARATEPQKLRRLLDGDLDNIVLMAMRKEPERRYSSVEQFSEDIRRHLEQRPVIARKDTFGYRAEKFVRRNRVAVSAAAFVALAIVAALTVSLWQAHNARRQRDLAQRERSKAERINTFLQRMLSFSNQSVTSVWPVAQKRDVTVNQMLDEIAPQVIKELADQPDVRGQILRTIGSAYASQGQYDAAEKNFRAALDTQLALYGEDNHEVADTMLELGMLSYRQQNYEEAGQVLDRARTVYSKLRQTHSPDYSAAKAALASDYLGAVKLLQV